MIIKCTTKDNSGAYFSLYRNKRYCLWRIWDRKLPLIMFIGINPSKADENTNDPTIRRCIIFATDWGYGGLYMVNLYPGISDDPTSVPIATKLAMQKNDTYIKFMGDRCKDVVLMWGGSLLSKMNGRDKDIIKIFPNALCFGHNNDGSPKHPLYLPSTTKLIRYE